MTPTLDLHVDSIIQQSLFGYDVAAEHSAGLWGQPLFWHADLPRMREASYRGACMGIHWFPWESERGWRSATRQIAYLDRLARRAPDVRRMRGGGWSVLEEGQLGLAPGIEGAHVLNGDVGRVDRLAELDVAYLTLAHFSANSAATPSVGRGADATSGLTAFGRELVDGLQEVGVSVDLAHVNRPGVLETCERADRPVMCTHTGVRGVHDSPRNLSDEEVDAIAETSGVIGIVFAPIFLAGRLKADSRVVADHVEYVADRVGLAHLAIGSDYDGWLPTIPSDQRDCRDVGRLYEVLDARGWSEEALERLAWRNAAEVLDGTRRTNG